MLRDSHDIPYASNGVTIIWKEKGEWKYTNDIGTKRGFLTARPKDAVCVWTGQWRSDAFNIDWDDFNKAVA